MTDKLIQESANEQCFANSAKSSKDLEDVANEYGKETFVNECIENGVCDNNDLADAFKAGAQWQKEQMMKGIIEGTVNSELGSVITTNNKGTVLTERFNLENLHIGDKVKVVIIKK